MRFHLRLVSLAALLALGVACSDGDAAKRRYVENGNRLAAQKKIRRGDPQYRNALRIDDKFADRTRVQALLKKNPQDSRSAAPVCQRLVGLNESAGAMRP